MCGICGFVNTIDGLDNVGYEIVKKMNNEIRHRGPDGEGIWIHEDNYCGLGHRRLSIIDLDDSAAQPMSNGGV